MLIRPAIYYIDYEAFKINDVEYIKILIGSANLPEEFSVNEQTSGQVRVKIGNQITTKDSILYYIIREEEVPTYTWTKALNAEENKTCILYLKNTVTTTSFSSDAVDKDKILLHMGMPNETVVGLGLNASINSSILPAQSFSIIELEKDSYKPRVILGKIPSNIVDILHGANDATDEYGLYADNVYLKGEIIATGGKIGGIEIVEGGLQSIGHEIIKDDDDNIISSSGWRIAPNGSVFFSSGTFNGTINATGGMIGDVEIKDAGL
jgi:hypothetical protein